MKHRLVIFGSGSFGLPSFKTLNNSQAFEIAAVISQPARPIGRKQVLTPTSVARWAEIAHLQLFTPERLRHDAKFLEELANLKGDLYLVADYGLIIPAEILNQPRLGAVNIHASLLPAWRGASPIVQTILAGEKTTGVTFMKMDVGLDTGPLLKQFTYSLNGRETRPMLEEELSSLAASHIEDTLKRFIAGEITPKPQDNTGRTLAPKITVEDGRATWNSAVTLERKIRAFQPWPGLWSTWNGLRMKILEAHVHSGSPLVAPGTIEIEGKSWKIACQDGWLIPTVVHFSGKKQQPAETVPGSYPGFIGSRLD